MSEPMTPPPTSAPTAAPVMPPIPPQPMAYATPGVGLLPPGYIEPDPNQRSLAMVAFLLGLAGGWLGPLIFFLIKKDDPTTSPYLRDQMTESLNWQLTVLIGGLVCIPLFFLLIGILLLPALFITSLVFMILNAMKANRGEVARFPWRIRFVK